MVKVVVMTEKAKKWNRPSWTLHDGDSGDGDGEKACTNDTTSHRSSLIMDSA